MMEMGSEARLSVSALTLTSCVILSKLSNFFMPQFPHLQSGDNKTSS